MTSSKAAAISFFAAAMFAASLPAMGQASATPEAKPASPPVERAAVSGRSQRMAVFYSLNPDCAARGAVQLRTVSPPEHGKISFENASDFPNYDKDNPRFECDKAEVPVVALYYRSEDGYSGPDSFTIESLYPDGNGRTTRYVVDVWAGAITPAPVR